jgi:thiosulfate/3-mercaptopyruvate sulfurtransferase
MALETDVSLLISPEALRADASAVVFDCRFSLLDNSQGRREYEAGHIPGARFADLERDLSAPPARRGGRHPLPDRAVLAARFQDWGVTNGSRIVCYDQNNGAVAVRLWWMTRWLGHAKVAVLDGGLDAWIAAGFEADSEIVSPILGDFTPGEPLTRVCAADELADVKINLLDARDTARFRGEVEPIDAVAGHIPGAISAPFADNLEGSRFKSPDALRARFRDLNIDPDIDSVCYCGSGVTANHIILALLLAGYREPILYAGSWSDWITDPKRPVATA